MDEDGGEQMDQFHRNEAISAVADEGFLGEEEEDDDYEDLYNDVNVGEGFLQSMRKNEDSGFGNEVVEEKKIEQQQQQQQAPLVAQEAAVSIPGVGGGSGEGTGGGDVGARVAAGRVGGEGYSNSNNQNLGFRGGEMGLKVNVGSGPSVGGGSGMRVELGQGSSKMNDFEEQSGNTSVGVHVIGQQPQQQQQPQQLQQQQPPPPQQVPPPHVGVVGNVGNMVGDGMMRQPGVGVNVNGVGGNNVVGGVGVGVGVGGGGGGTILFVGDLHWWTTDSELESELCKYGQVKEVKFFDEKASGKSKGYCQVEFYDPAAATACKEGMNGHLFNGRPCLVAFASPFSVKRMGEAQVNRNQQMTQTNVAQARRPNDTGVKPGGNNIATGGNYQGADTNTNTNNNNRGFGRGNWGRGNAQNMGNRGPVGPMRNRGGGMSGRGIMGNGGNGFGQGLGATPPLLHPQSMMGQGFDPAFGAPMGRMGSYGGFPGAPTPPFSGILSSFPPVGGVGLPGVAPHVNPAFFGRGMPMNGMGMMPTAGVDGPNMGMWSDPSMGGWGGGEEHGGGRAAESSYGEEAASDHQYGEVSHDRGGGWPNPMKEKDRGSERDWSGSSDRRYREDRDQAYERDVPREKDTSHDDWSERRHRDDRDAGRERERERDRDRERSRDRERERDRDRHREDRDRYADHHRYRDRETEHDDEWERGRSSRTHNKGRVSQEDDHRSRSRDADYGKRRRLTSE
ncbi:hypothetical protein F8388_008173 [Cannabis sativa]|uniref:RRM domain-containing protein n=1 Tax=Cannabis sativa TaxID=3483 RepID=A0A7J6EX80_CANSA|nr:hypothetical protein F8388_008173 [Cannabis sativa]KAF4391294.1 hypothetical protein G4B88_016604 [Cannabis sativa]